jgi:hypothetical protein
VVTAATPLNALPPPSANGWIGCTTSWQRSTPSSQHTWRSVPAGAGRTQPLARFMLGKKLEKTACYSTMPNHISPALYAVNMVTHSTNRSLGSLAGTTTMQNSTYKYSCIPAPSSNFLLLGSPRLTNSIKALTNSYG